MLDGASETCRPLNLKVMISLDLLWWGALASSCLKFLSLIKRKLWCWLAHANDTNIFSADCIMCHFPGNHITSVSHWSLGKVCFYQSNSPYLSLVGVISWLHQAPNHNLTNGDRVPCCHVASLGLSVFTHWGLSKMTFPNLQITFPNVFSWKETFMFWQPAWVQIMASNQTRNNPTHKSMLTHFTAAYICH